MDRPPTLDWACIFCHESSLFFQPDMEAQDKLIYRSYQYMRDPRGKGSMELIVGPSSEHISRSIRYRKRSSNPDSCTGRHLDSQTRVESVYPGRTPTSDGDTAYCPAIMHAACLQLARERLPYFNARLIDRFSRYTMTIMPRFLIDGVVMKARARPTPPFPTSRLNDTELAALLRRAAELPPEIQAHICTFLTPGLASCLLNAHKTLEWAETRLEAIDEFTYNGRGEIAIPRYSTAPFTFLGAKSIFILGETCLTNIGTDPSGDYDHLISIDEQGATGELRGIDYMLGTYGVCAMRLQYRDRSVSAWLGSEFGWFTSSPLKNLRDLAWADDGIKITGMRPSPPPDRPEARRSTNVTRLFWKRDMQFPPTTILRVIDMSIQSPMVIRFHPRDRFVQHLPFTSGDRRMHSFTVFSNADGVSCIQTIGTHRWRRLGEPSPYCCAVTHYLHANEAVDSVFIVSRRSRNLEEAQGPFLLIKTSTGRFLYFGTFIMPFMPITQANISSFGYENTHKATGIFFDPVSTVLGGIETIGVVLKPRANIKERPPTELVVKLPVETRLDRAFFLDKNTWTAFASHASFSGLKVLRVQKTLVRALSPGGRDSMRCRGLMAEFDDGRLPAILGQWDPSYKGTYTVHTVDKDGPLRSLTFVVARFGPYPPWVQTVAVNSPPLSVPCFVWADLSVPISWFFTYNADLVEPWAGDTWDVKVTENAVPCQTVH